VSDQEPPDLEDLWPPGFRRDDRIVVPLGLFEALPGEDPHFAMLLAICNNTAIIAERLGRLVEQLDDS